MFKTILGFITSFVIGCFFFSLCNNYFHDRIVVNKVRHALGTCENAWRMNCTMIAVPTSLIRALDQLNNNAPASSSSTSQPSTDAMNL